MQYLCNSSLTVQVKELCHCLLFCFAGSKQTDEESMMFAYVHFYYLPYEVTDFHNY